MDCAFLQSPALNTWRLRLKHFFTGKATLKMRQEDAVAAADKRLEELERTEKTKESKTSWSFEWSRNPIIWEDKRTTTKLSSDENVKQPRRKLNLNGWASSARPPSR
jgi:hypothetical protein